MIQKEEPSRSFLLITLLISHYLFRSFSIILSFLCGAVKLVLDFEVSKFVQEGLFV